MPRKVSFTHNPIAHAKLLRILCNIESMSFINTNFNISSTCCTLGHNPSTLLKFFSFPIQFPSLIYVSTIHMHCLRCGHSLRHVLPPQAPLWMEARALGLTYY
jgi:hypothetical protein